MPIETPEVKSDCRHYIGYKPCGFAENCDGCPHYVGWGKRILVVKLGAAGDVIRTTPILNALRRVNDPCQITWITDPISVELLEETKSIDRLMAYSAENCMILQAQRFDLLLNFEKEPRALALAELVSADKKLGFGAALNGAAHAYNEESLYALRLGLSDDLKFHHNQKTYPEIVYEMIRMSYQGEEYEIALSDEGARFRDDFAHQHHFDPNVPVVGLNTGCGEVFQSKQWTAEGFAGLIRGLRETGGCRPMLLGGPREGPFNKALMETAGEGVVDSGCDNSIEQFMGLIDLCDLVVSADTMAMHIAIGLKKEVVAMFGPTCHQEVGLFGRGEKIVANRDCAPCYKKICDRAPSCMEELESATVLAAVQRRLEPLGSKGKAS